MAFSFGSATPAAGAFGASTTPAFGSSAGGFGFGSSAASPRPAFGGTGTVPGSSPGGGFGFSSALGTSTGFGAAISAPAAGGGTSLFSSPSAPNPIGALVPASSPFGAPAAAASTAAPAPAAGSLFSFPQQPQATAFGAPAAGQQAGPLAAVGLTQQLPQPQAGAVLGAGAAVGGSRESDAELSTIMRAYNERDEHFQFRHLFLSIVGKEALKNESYRLPPEGVNRLMWRDAVEEAGGVDNPDGVWPVQAAGFSDLLLRKTAQDTALAENKEWQEKLLEAATAMLTQHGMALRQRLQLAERKQAELSQRLLRCFRSLDGLQGHQAAMFGFHPPETEVAKVDRSLQAVESELLAPQGIMQRSETMADSAMARAGANDSRGSLQLGERSMQQLAGVLDDHMKAIGKLSAILREDERDLQIMDAGSYQLEAMTMTVERERVKA